MEPLHVAHAPDAKVPVLQRHAEIPVAEYIEHSRTASGFEPEGEHYTTISGPSFLGLTDSPESDATEYLLDDDQPRRGRVGWYIFSTAAIAILAVIGLLEWRAYKTGKLSIPFLQSSSAESPKSADQPATANTPPANQPTQAAAAAAPQATPPEPSHTIDSESDGPPSSNAPTEKAGAAAPASAQNGSVATKSPVTTKGNSGTASPSPSEKAESKSSTSAESVAENDTATPASSRTDRVGRKSSPAPEKLAEEKPDPRLNRMLLAGEKYLYGRGVRRDCNQAVIYFRAAAEQGNAPAMSHLGALYASGECTTQNRAAAYAWFRRAQETDPQNQWIEKNMNMVWRDMTPQERASISH